MTWQDQWRALDARMAGILEAGHFVIQSLQVSSDDAYGTTTRLSAHASAIVTELEAFHSTYAATLPPRASQALSEFLSKEKASFTGAISGFHGAQLSIVLLASLRSVLNYHLGDFTTIAKRRSERAFVHLQQTIIADSVVQERWADALKRGEPACERLGGAHLLLHGIWAFKAHGPGARTDLVLGEPLSDIQTVEQVADALVLTEWKVVRKGDSSEEIAASARNQATLYGQGLLGGIELAAYRYIVLVSSGRIPMPSDVTQGGVTYRHIGIAVAPEAPSRAA